MHNTLNVVLGSINRFDFNQFQDIINKLKDLEKLFYQFRNLELVPAISSNEVVVRRELEILDTIWKRFLKNRIDLLKVLPIIQQHRSQQTLDDDEAGKLFEQDKKLSAELEVDLKCIFIFGDIFFYKFILLARSIYGDVKSIEYNSFTAFLKSLRKLTKQSGGSLFELYESLGDDLEKIDVLVGFYRDKFIVHVLGPYEEGVNTGVNYHAFRLSHASRKLSKFDFQRFNELISNLTEILPDNDRFGRPLTSESDPRPKVDVLFQNLYKIKDASLRERAEGFIRSVGISTPDIYCLVQAIKDVSIRFIDVLMEEIRNRFIDSDSKAIQ